ncbi:MAG: hypothetical protein NTX64_08310 [Elusimicrobia bacterium]|nr:hypothetical protein [Elusimicrobiota bacterium]
MRQFWLLAALVLSGNIPAAAYDDIRFLDPVRLQGLERPSSFVASANRLYVLDEKKSQLQILDASGAYLQAVGHQGSDKQGFSAPKGLAVAPDGTIFVADTGNSRIQAFDPDGKFLYAFGEKGSEPGQLRYPEGVAVAGYDRIFVSDTGNDRVQVFTREGIFLYGFGQKGSMLGQLKDPGRIFVDPADNVFVLEAGNDRIQKFDASARGVKEFPVSGTDFALDSYGFLYVLEPKAGKVREIAPDGHVPGAFGSRGEGLGQLKAPSAVTIASDGTILVLDTGNSRIQRAVLANKQKTERVAASTASRLLVTGPTSFKRIKAPAVAALGGRSCAYLEDAQKFSVIEGDGSEAFRFGKPGKEPSATAGSGGLALTEKDGVFVSDTGDDRMQHFDAEGKWLANFAESTGFFDSKKQEGRVKAPLGVAVSDKGTVYVADSGNARVDAFTPQGAFLFSFGPQIGSVLLEQPVGVAFDPAGFVYVLDRKLGRVVKAEPSGGFVASWGELGEGPGKFTDPVAIACDGKSYVYVLDAGAKRVSVFHKDDGHWITNFFGAGEDVRGLQAPAALAVDGDRLLVSDPAKAKLLFFKLRPLAAPPTSVSTSAVEGTVELNFKPSPDPWVVRYRVWRSPAGSDAYAEAGTVDKPPFKDASVETGKGYLYRVAAEASTGDVGPRSEPVPVFVPESANRSPVELGEVDISNLLPANYKWYLKNAAGKSIVVNNVNVPFENVKVSFRLKDFMDFATESVIPKLFPAQKVEVPLMATLNNHILEITEETPIQAEISVTFFEGGKQRTVSIAKPLRVYSRNGMIWDNPERVNAFITSNDTPVLEFGKKVRHDAPPLAAAAAGLDRPLVDAIRLWHALGELGVRFQDSATNPFETVQQDPTFPVDYTQFPRETLKRKAGKCDDLTALLASLFTGANVETAVLDYPGHLALMFDTGQAEAADAGLPESEMVSYNGHWWIPIEPTLVGSSFADAHHQALATYRDMDKTHRVRVIDPRKAVASFEPVTMAATEWTVPTPDAAAVAKKVDAEAAAYAESRYKFLKGLYEARGEDAENLNQLGLLEAEMGHLDAALARFEKARAADASSAAALNNIGSVAFLTGDWAKAEESFNQAAAADPSDVGIWLNLAKTAAKLKDPVKLKTYGQKALAAAGESDRPTVETALRALSKE